MESSLVRRHAAAPARLLLLAAAAVVLLAASAAGLQTNSEHHPKGQGKKRSVPMPTPGDGPVVPSVVGGAAAPQGRFPYHAFVWSNVMVNDTTGEYGWYFCGSSLIRDDVAVTAAHCLTTFGIVANKIELLTDAYYNPAFYYDSGTYYGPVAPRNIVVHDGFDNKTIVNDIGLIFADTCMTNGSRVTTVEIATKSEYAAAKRSTFLASGFGSTSEGAHEYGYDGELPEVLQVAQVKYVKPNVCAGIFGSFKPPFDKESQICAGGVLAVPGTPLNTPLQDVCQGDSGGPLVFSTQRGKEADPLSAAPSSDRLVGLTSNGWGCGQQGLPGIYTNIPNYKKWIAQQLDARKKPCAAAAEPTCKRASSTQNYYQYPDLTVTVDKADAYAMCCAECQARAKADGGCMAYSVKHWVGGRRLQQATNPSAPRTLLAAVAKNCTTCDAECDIYTGRVPTRLCKAGEELVPGTYVTCGIPSKGSARILWKY